MVPLEVNKSLNGTIDDKYIVCNLSPVYFYKIQKFANILLSSSVVTLSLDSVRYYSFIDINESFRHGHNCIPKGPTNNFQKIFSPSYCNVPPLLTHCLLLVPFRYYVTRD